MVVFVTWAQLHRAKGKVIDPAELRPTSSTILKNCDRMLSPVTLIVASVLGSAYQYAWSRFRQASMDWRSLQERSGPQLDAITQK
jgi:hypothetical protein